MRCLPQRSSTFSVFWTLLWVGVIVVLLGAGLPAARAQDAIPRTGTFPGLPDGPFPYAAPEEVGLSAQALHGLADRVTEWVRQDRIVGAEILIVKDRKIVLHEAIGWSDREVGEPMRRNSIYRVRSMTKPFTGTAALMLVDGGEARARRARRPLPPLMGQRAIA